MALDTYTALQASVASWLHRTDLTAQIPDFIALAEAQMNRKLRVRPMVAQASVSVSTEYFEAPSDFLEERSLIYTDDRPIELQYRTQEEIDAIQLFETTPGRPTLYTIVGGQFRFDKTPDQAYPLTLTYFQRIPALSATNATNWLLGSHPDAYLYGALLQAAPFKVDDDRVAMWAQAFTSITDFIQAALAERTGHNLRTDHGLLSRRRHRFNIITGY